VTGARRRGTLAQRLLLAHALVIAAMTVTVVVAAAAVGPAVFDNHMRLAGHADQPAVLAHAQEAFRSAGLQAVAVGLAIGGLGALAVSAFVTRRLGLALGSLAEGAGRVARGDYSRPVDVPPGGRELASVAASFNAMAARLAATEATRRRLLTDLSHEMRTPIATIDVVLEGLDDGVLPADATTTATLRQQTARLARLASDIRDVSAAEEGRLALHPEPVPLADLLRAAAAAAAPAYQARGVRLEMGGVPDAVVAADRTRMGQVLDNLLRNAVQHTPPGGLVEVTAERADGGVRVCVRDNGAGIAADELPHVFERFYRGDTARRHDQGAGTGVGLAIARAIVEAHGGTLTAASDGPGRGAEFVVAWPAA